MHHNLEIIHCHGSENYFLLVNGFSRNLNFKEPDYQQFTLSSIESLSGLKIDGVLYLLPSQNADARMRIFNKDGSEAEMCGNGFRCISKKLQQITGQTKFKIETLSGIIEGTYKPGIFSDLQTYSVIFTDIGFRYGQTIYENTLIPELDDTLRFSSVDIGNPHLITAVNEMDLYKLKKLGEKINNKDCLLFPNGNNLSFYQILDNQLLYVMTYERGVGLTHSCGTAMAATTLLAAKQKKIPFAPIHVHNEGGMVMCLPVKHNGYHIELIGNASFIQELQIIYDSECHILTEVKQTAFKHKEINYYLKFKYQIQQKI